LPKGKIKYVPLQQQAQYAMDMRKKKKIIILALCTGIVALLAVYLGIFADREEPPFETKIVYSLPLGENEVATVRFVTATDFTGDGREEVLISYDVAVLEQQMIRGNLTTAIRFTGARVLILSRDAVGNFQKLWEHDLGLTRQTVIVDDFDGDGKLDVVVGGFKAENINEQLPLITSKVEVLLQREDCSFVRVFSPDIPGLLGPVCIVAGDFDGDGRADFVVGGFAIENESPYRAYFFRNEDGENFTSIPIALREGIIVNDMWEADVDGDGSLDLVVHAFDLDSENYRIFLLLNDGWGEFEFRELGVFADIMEVKDLTGNGYPDIIYAKRELGGEVYWLRNDGGKFAEPKSTNIRYEGIIGGIISADFNNDNTPEVLLLEEVGKFREDLKEFEISVIGHLLQVEEKVGGELSFARAWTHRFLEGRISSEHAVTATDINNDGWIDLILVREDGGVYLDLNQLHLE